MRADQQLEYPEWQIPLEGVITESEVEKLPSRIHAVEALISERLKQLDASKNGAAEREAINTALNILRTVKRERLGFPDWK
jgi:Trp operon repressor